MVVMHALDLTRDSILFGWNSLAMVALCKAQSHAVL